MDQVLAPLGNGWQAQEEHRLRKLERSSLLFYVCGAISARSARSDFDAQRNFCLDRLGLME